MSNKRIEYFDGIKGLGILLVVFCHYVLLSEESIAGNVVMTLAWSAVPCFMMISGALMHHTQRFSWRKYGTKLAQVYLVMVAWRLIYWAVISGLCTVTATKAELVQYLFFFIDLDDFSMGFLWYMVAYLVVLMVYPVTWYLFRRCEKEGKQLVLFLMLVAFAGSIFLSFCSFCLDVLGRLLGCSVVRVDRIAAIMPFVNYGNMLFYFLLGAFLLEYQERIRQMLDHRRWLAPVMIAAGLCGLLFVKYVLNGTVRWEGIYLADGYMRLSTVIMSLGMFFLFMQGTLKRTSHLLAGLLGKYTFGIYYLHALVLIVCEQFLYPLIPGRSFGMNCAKTLVVTAFCALVTVLMRRIPVVRRLFA